MIRGRRSTIKSPTGPLPKRTGPPNSCPRAIWTLAPCWYEAGLQAVPPHHGLRRSNVGPEFDGIQHRRKLDQLLLVAWYGVFSRDCRHKPGLTVGGAVSSPRRGNAFTSQTGRPSASVVE